VVGLLVGLTLGAIGEPYRTAGGWVFVASLAGVLLITCAPSSSRK
jgi:hypothetical protein